MKSNLRVVWMFTVALCILFSVGQVAAGVTAVEKEQADNTRIVLKVSPDGKSLVDQDGREVVRFADCKQVAFPDASSENSLPGCMCCTEDNCMIYEGGRCIKYVRFCQWDFDCSCK